MINALTIFTVYFCLGIMAANTLSLNFTLTYLLLIFTAIALIFIKNQRLFLVLLFSAAFLAGSARFINSNPQISKKPYSAENKLKQRTAGIIYKYLDGAPAGILEAMILGDKDNVPQPLLRSMVYSGTIHILVVSGFNVGLVCFLAMILLKLARFPKYLRIVIAGLLILVYCFLTGASNPVVRATIMAEVFLFSYFFKRIANIYNSLAVAALFILISDPRQLFDPSFQLSFSSVLAIVYLFPVLKTRFQLENIKQRVLKFLIDGFLVSFSAWMGTVGFIAYYFRLVSPVTVLANIFIVPLATLITLCGFGLVITSYLFPFLADLFAFNIKLLIGILVLVNSSLIKIPGAYYRF